MNLFIRISLIIVAIATLQGCGETTFDSNNHVDSFINLTQSAPSEADKDLLNELWGIYLSGYVDHNGNIVEPDFAKLDGMNAEEMLQELKNYVDYVQFEGFEMATVDDDGNYVNPSDYGSSGGGANNPTVGIEVYGNAIYFTSKVDKAQIKDVIVNRGNCTLHTPGWIIFESEEEYRKVKAKYPNDQSVKLHEQTRPVPFSAEFGKKIKRVTGKRCNIIEVTVVDNAGEWTWMFD